MLWAAEHTGERGELRMMAGRRAVQRPSVDAEGVPRAPRRSCITYYPVGLAPEASRFFYFILILFLLHSMVRI